MLNKNDIKGTPRQHNLRRPHVVLRCFKFRSHSCRARYHRAVQIGSRYIWWSRHPMEPRDWFFYSYIKVYGSYMVDCSFSTVTNLILIFHGFGYHFSVMDSWNKIKRSHGSAYLHAEVKYLLLKWTKQTILPNVPGGSSQLMAKLLDSSVTSLTVSNRGPVAKDSNYL